MITNADLLENLKFFEWLIHKRKFCSLNRGSPFEDTSKGQGRILLVLSIEDGLKTKELADRVGIRTSSLNELLAKMEKNDLIKRYPSIKDKRVIIISLTEKGKKLVPKNSDYTIFECLSPEERNSFYKILTKLNNELEKSLKDTEDIKIINSCKSRKAAFKRYLEKQDNIIKEETYV